MLLLHTLGPQLAPLFTETEDAQAQCPEQAALWNLIFVLILLDLYFRVSLYLGKATLVFH